MSEYKVGDYFTDEGGTRYYLYSIYENMAVLGQDGRMDTEWVPLSYVDRWSRLRPLDYWMLGVEVTDGN